MNALERKSSAAQRDSLPYSQLRAGRWSAAIVPGIAVILIFVYSQIFGPTHEESQNVPVAEVSGGVDVQNEGADLAPNPAAGENSDELPGVEELPRRNSLLAKIARRQTYSPGRAGDLSPERLHLPRDRIHAVALRTDDGLTLNGWHLLADGCSAADRAECDRELSLGRPLALYFPGNSGHRGDRLAEAGLLTGAGADVLLFDWRGYGDNPGTPAEEAFAADARAVWRYVTVDRRVAPRRIILYGESIGGAVATRLASELCTVSDSPAGLFIRSTTSNLADTARFRYPFLPEKMLPAERYDAVDSITRVTCPIVMLHGEQDQTIPHALGRKVFDAAPETSGGGIPKQFVDLPHSDHNGVVETDGELLKNAVDEFVRRLFPRR